MKRQLSRNVYLLLAFAFIFVVGCGAPALTGDFDLDDGTYEGFSDPGPRGYVAAELVIEDGEIVDAKLMEFDGQGERKTADTYDYEPWIEAENELPEQIVANQSSDIDAVSGATSTSDKFEQAVKRALGEEEAFAVGDYQDGVYQAESDPTDRGDYVEVSVTILLGTIVDVDMAEYREDGSEKDPDEYDHEPWVEAVETLPAAVVDAQSADVDTVSGATSTSELFQQAVQRALDQAS